MARYFGLRLLRNSFTETSRALQSEMLNHILVSATPVGLCIVRQSDYSVLTTNALAIELLGIEADGNRLPPHIVGEFLVQAPDQPSAMSFARVAAFVAPARPAQMLPQSLHQSPTKQRDEPQTSLPPDQTEARPHGFCNSFTRPRVTLARTCCSARFSTSPRRPCSNANCGMHSKRPRR